MFERRHPLAILFVIATILGMTGWFFGGSRVKDLAPYYFDKIIGRTATVQIRGALIQAEIAKTQHAREKGLSGREYLSRNNGMVFLFPRAGQYSFTMKKTALALDIVWVSEGKIVFIKSPAVPETPIIDPGVESDLVLEVNTGVVHNYGWRVGDDVSVVLNPSLFRF